MSDRKVDFCWMVYILKKKVKKKKKRVNQKNKIHKQPEVSVCRTGMYWVKRMKIIFCVLSLKLLKSMEFQKGHSPSGNVIVWWLPQYKGGTAQLHFHKAGSKREEMETRKMQVSFIHFPIPPSSPRWCNPGDYRPLTGVMLSSASSMLL